MLKISRPLFNAFRAMSAKKPNNLINERSPYLLQHAHNPVEWYPWSQQAFDLAKSTGKPIFLSIGYSTCHWCHVMERESFENADIGRYMSEKFVCIKVDREEHPDVDQIYMTFVQATSGHGGWPLSVWLTPELKPIFGGTYFPPGDNFGRPGFKTVLEKVAQQWIENRDQIENAGSRVVDAISQLSNEQHQDGSVAQLDITSVADRCFIMLDKSFDEKYGGFSKRPKFPNCVNLTFLLRYWLDNESTELGDKAIRMASKTLETMRLGGICDHVDKGFHRYSTDQQWHVPHFEKMLYDQSQLVLSYLETGQVLKKKNDARSEQFFSTAQDILTYVSSDMSHSDSGGFFAAEDADSLPNEEATVKQEGAFCVWTYDELEALLGDDFHLFAYHFNCKPEGNVNPELDPHNELEGKNVLTKIRPDEAPTSTAEVFKIDSDELETKINRCLSILAEKRRQRPPPHCDRKMITSWNAMMISAFAKAGAVLNRDDYVGRAKKGMAFIKQHLFVDGSPGSVDLLRGCYADEVGSVVQTSPPIKGFLEDFANTIQALLDLFEVTQDQQYLLEALELQRSQDQLFWDDESDSSYFTGRLDPSLVVRLKPDQDGAEPSGNSTSCLNLTRLSAVLGKTTEEGGRFAAKADKIVRSYSTMLKKMPVALPALVAAAMGHGSSNRQIVLVGNQTNDTAQAMLRSIHERYMPLKTLICIDPLRPTADDSPIRWAVDLSQELAETVCSDGEKCLALVCRDYSCQLPTDSVEKLNEILQ